MLRTLEDLKKHQPAPREDKKAEKKTDFAEEIAKALGSGSRRRSFDSTKPLTISEIDAVRRQIARCWNVPAGAKDAKDLVIDIRVEMNPDATVRLARIQDTTRLGSDPFFRAAAESALRAVLNPRCSPFKLPPDKFDHWKTMTLSFNPREMFGQ